MTDRPVVYTHALQTHLSPKENAMIMRGIAKSMLAHAALLDGGDNATDETVTASEEKSEIHVGEMKAKRGRPAGKKTQATTAAPTNDDALEAEDEDTPLDMGFDASEDEEAGALKTLTLKDDIIPAFKAYAKKHSYAEAGAVLKKFKVKSVAELPKEKYAQVMTTLGV